MKICTLGNTRISQEPLIFIAAKAPRLTSKISRHFKVQPLGKIYVTLTKKHRNLLHHVSFFVVNNDMRPGTTGPPKRKRTRLLGSLLGKGFYC